MYKTRQQRNHYYTMGHYKTNCLARITLLKAIAFQVKDFPCKEPYLKCDLEFNIWFCFYKERYSVCN